MTRGPAKQFDRDEVLDRAMEVFWQQGYEGAGMTALLEEMGIGRQSLYDTFGDKRNLFLEALSRYVRTVISPLLVQLKAPGSPLGNVRKVFEYWESKSREQHPGCLVGNSLAGFGEGEADLSEMLHGYMEQLEDAFTETLTRARQEGELRTRMAPRDLARTLVTLSQGAALRTRMHPDPELGKSLTRTAMHLLTSE